MVFYYLFKRRRIITLALLLRSIPDPPILYKKFIDNKIKLFKSTVQSGINRKAENDKIKCTEINHQSPIKYKTPPTPLMVQHNKF